MIMGNLNFVLFNDVNKIKTILFLLPLLVKDIVSTNTSVKFDKVLLIGADLSTNIDVKTEGVRHL